MKKRLEFGKRYEYKLPAGMIFKRMYCCKCGKKLSIKYVSIAYDPDKKWHGYGFFSGATIGARFRYSPKGTEYFEGLYRCKNCDYLISNENQKLVRQYQEAYRRRVLTEEEIERLKLIPKEEIDKS